MKLLCWLGVHRWTKGCVYVPYDEHHGHYNIICTRCGKERK